MISGSPLSGAPISAQGEDNVLYLTDAVGLGDSPAHEQVYAVALNDTVGVADIALLSYSIRCADTVALDDSLDVYSRIIAAIEDDVGLGDTLAMTGNMAFSLADTLGLDDTGTLNASMAFDIADTIGLWAVLKLGDDVYYGYAINAETNASSTYTNYAFNSFFELNGRYYGVTESGIYYLDGADDAGTAISAAIRTGVTDFGTKHRKRLPRAYVGYTSDGTMVLKTLTDDAVERWYSLAQAGDAYTVKRAKLGRGVDFSYLQMEIVNVDGADFEIDSLSLMPIVLQRRIK